MCSVWDFTNSVFGKILSRSFLLSIARRTFQKNNIDKRKMMGAAGIKYRSPRKKRELSGKSRGNCPVCGRISWSFNPYEHMPCVKHE